MLIHLSWKKPRFTTDRDWGKSSQNFRKIHWGQEIGSKAAMDKIFKEESVEVVLLVDATNAFNSINRKMFLHNTSILSTFCNKLLCNSSSAMSNRWYRNKI